MKIGKRIALLIASIGLFAIGGLISNPENVHAKNIFTTSNYRRLKAKYKRKEQIKAYYNQQVIQYAQKTNAQQQPQTKTTTNTQKVDKSGLYNQAKQQLNQRQASIKQEYAAKKQQAENNYHNAYNNAPKKTVNVQPATPQNNNGVDIKQGIPWSNTFDVSDNTTVHIKHINSSAIISSEGQLPTDFNPGFLFYDYSKDHSEKIGPNGLDDNQKNKLNQLATMWMNSLRYQFYTDPSLKDTLHKNGIYFTQDSPRVTKTGYKNQTVNNFNDYKLHITSNAVKAAKAVTDYREQHNIREYIHNWNIPGTKDSRNIIKDALNNPNALSMENLACLDSSRETMLQYEVQLFNALNSMYWGEYDAAKRGDDIAGGHLLAVLSPNYNNVSIALQNMKPNKHTPENGYRSINSDDNDYYLFVEFYSVVKNRNQQTNDIDGQDETQDIASEINNERQQGVPDYNAQSIKDAYNQIGKVDAEERDALNQAQNDYNSRVSAINNLPSTKTFQTQSKVPGKPKYNIAQLSAKLNQQLNNMKRYDNAVLANFHYQMKHHKAKPYKHSKHRRYHKRHRRARRHVRRRRRHRRRKHTKRHVRKHCARRHHKRH